MLGQAGQPRLFRLWCSALLVALLLGIGARQAHAQQGPQFPPLTGRVTDAANIIPPDIEARLDQKLAALETQSHRQLVIVTIPSLQDYDIADYGYQLGRNWGIGSKERNDGALLIVAPADRKLRIEVGYGLEGVLTDGMSSLIINQAIVPRFKAGDMPGGIEAGTDAIIKQLTLPADEAQKIAQQASARPAQQGFDPGWIVGALIFVFFFLIPLIRSLGSGGRRYRSRGGMPPVMIWPGGFGGGGGGFSGGGGSFGGGGSSGSW
jgi:uncharacterized protein